MSTITENPIAGTGAYSHHVPMVAGHVVEIRDGNHNGTSVWRRDQDLAPYVFASHDTGQIGYAERCILVRGQDVEAIPVALPYGCCLSVPDGLCLIGIDRDTGLCDDDFDWLSEGAEILWDSAVHMLDKIRREREGNDAR